MESSKSSSMGGGIGMGNTCKPMAVSFQCMTKSTTIKKKEKKKKRVPVVPQTQHLVPEPHTFAYVAVSAQNYHSDFISFNNPCLS